MNEVAAESTLDRLGPDQSGCIIRVEGSAPVARRLMELGLVTGTEVRVVRRAPFGDPIELVVRGVHLSLRRSEARLIHVERR